jgi:lipopolysaccharide biosynthesis glycosyltransferase
MNNKNPTVYFAMSCDNKYKYLFYLTVCLESIMKFSNKNINYLLYLFTNSWSDEQTKIFNKFTDNYKNLTVQLFDLEKTQIQKTNYINQRYSVSAISRLYLPVILKNLKKIIYFDCDLFIRVDIKTLYDIELDKYWVGCVKDYGLISLVERNSKKYLCNYPHFANLRWNDYVYKILEMKDHRNQFNSGVMLINLESFRENDLTKKCVSDYERIKPVFADQCVLNKHCENNIKYISSEWNVLSSQQVTLGNITKIYKKAKIIHKPWKHVLIKNEFYDLALKSPFKKIFEKETNEKRKKN